MDLPEVAPGYKIVSSWIDGNGVIVLAVNDEDKKVRIHLWDRIAKNYLEFFTFDKYEVN